MKHEQGNDEINTEEKSKKIINFAPDGFEFLDLTVKTIDDEALEGGEGKGQLGPEFNDGSPHHFDFSKIWRPKVVY